MRHSARVWPAGVLSALIAGALGAVAGPLALGIMPAASWLGSRLVVAERIRPVDAIVVLGAGAYDDRTLTPQSAYRLLRGIQLLQAGHAPVIILSGGGHRGTAVTDAKAMAEVARSLGVDTRSMILDEIPVSTWRQAQSVASIARDRGLRSVALVTSPLHSYRAARTFRQTGLDVVSVPAAADFNPRLLTVGEDHLAGRLEAASRALYEYVAIVGYRLRGRL